MFWPFNNLTKQELAAQLAPIAADISNLKELIMATAEQFQAGFDRVNVATSGIAALIRKLIDQKASGMTAEEEEAAFVQLGAMADSLEAMAATPTDPVPVPVPTP